MQANRLKGTGILLAIVAGLVAVAGTPRQGLAQTGGPVVVTVADAAEITNFDPHRSVNAPSISLVNHVYDALLIMGRDGFHPMLATKWEASPDGKSYTFSLRRGVKFHDGTDFDARAVKVNFDRVSSPEMKGTIGHNYLGMIKETVVVDSHTVRVMLNEPFGAFLAHLGHPSVGHIVSPTAVAKDGWDSIRSRPVGTGPYRFVEWVRGDRVVLERFDGYWGPRPGITRLIYRPVAEAATRVAMVEKGEAHLALNLPVEDVPRLSRLPNLQIIRATAITTNALFINTQRKPFDEVRVRRALNHAVDKKRIIDSIFGGAAVAVDSPVAPQVFAYKKVAMYEYNLDKARQLLAEAGVRPGLKVKLDFDRATPKIAEVAVAATEMLQRAGFVVETEFFGDYALYLQTRGKRDYHMTFYAWGPFSLDPDALFFPLYHSSLVGKHFNYANYARPEVDRLIETARASSSQNERRRLYGQLQDMVMADAPAIYLYWMVANAAAVKRLSGLWIDPRVMFWLQTARLQ